MRREDNDPASLPVAGYQARKLQDRLSVESDRGFIKQPERTVVSHKPSKGQTPSLSGGEKAAGCLAQPFKPQDGQRIGDRCFPGVEDCDNPQLEAASGR